MSTEICQIHEDVITALRALPDVLSQAELRKLRRQLRDLSLQHPRFGNYWSWIFV